MEKEYMDEYDPEVYTEERGHRPESPFGEEERQYRRGPRGRRPEAGMRREPRPEPTFTEEERQYRRGPRGHRPEAGMRRDPRPEPPFGEEDRQYHRGPRGRRPDMRDEFHPEPPFEEHMHDGHEHHYHAEFPPEPPFEDRHHGHRPEPRPFYEMDDSEASNDISHLLSACADRYARRGGRKNSQLRILQILGEEEIIPQRELQEILDVQPGSLSELLLKLENKGFIERIRSEEDKRKVYVRITEEGKEHAEDMHAQFDQEDSFAVLSEEEQETLRSLLKKLLSEQ